MSKYKITVKVKKQHKKIKKLKNQINNLKINSKEMSEELCHIYAVFRQKAYEDPDTDLPFPHLIM